MFGYVRIIRVYGMEGGAAEVDPEGGQSDFSGREFRFKPLIPVNQNRLVDA